MVVAMLLLAVGAALIGGGTVWAMAGFWWAVLAYSGIGAAIMLLTASALCLAASPAEARHRVDRARLGTVE